MEIKIVNVPAKKLQKLKTPSRRLFFSCKLSNKIIIAKLENIAIKNKTLNIFIIIKKLIFLFFFKIIFEEKTLIKNKTNESILPNKKPVKYVYEIKIKEIKIIVVKKIINNQVSNNFLQILNSIFKF